jgi:hypothetical protein
LRPQQTARERRLAWVVRGKQRTEVTVPLTHEIQPPFLHPAVKVTLRNLVGIVEYAVFGSENLDWSFLD